MNNKIVRISALYVLITTCAFAQQKETISSQNELNEVVVSDSKFALAKEKSGKVITKITAEDLKKNAGQSIATILNTVAGLEINGNHSVAGKNLGYYIRGGKNRQVLILIDGIPVNDASGISFEYDLRLLPVDQVESIEIMKGAASTLYGSGAATGVINITLKKSGKKAIAGNAYLNMGTNNTAFTKKTSAQDFNQGFSVNGNVKKVGVVRSPDIKFTNLAVKEFENWKFLPGKKDGKAVKSQYRWYFNQSLSELDINPNEFSIYAEVMPEIVGGLNSLQEKITYPEIAKRAGIEGKVYVLTFIDENGDVAAAKVIKGIGAGCDEEALNAVKNTKFTPARDKGKNVKVQVSVPIYFKL